MINKVFTDVILWSFSQGFDYEMSVILVVPAGAAFQEAASAEAWGYDSS
jgi:hypothetical protein